MRRRAHCRTCSAPGRVCATRPDATSFGDRARVARWTTAPQQASRDGHHRQDHRPRQAGGGNDLTGDKGTAQQGRDEERKGEAKEELAREEQRADRAEARAEERAEREYEKADAEREHAKERADEVDKLERRT